MGDEVIRRLGLEMDMDAFHLGCLGPDPYIYYRFFVPPFKHEVNNWSHVMHTEKTGKFLMELAERAKDSGDISFLAGFLCHYALDSTVHPLINGLAGDKGYMHMAIEHKLEVMDGGKMKFAELKDSVVQIMGSVVEKVYGFPQAGKRYRTGYQHLKLFFQIAEDRHRILSRIFKCGKFAALSYHTALADDLDLSRFDELRERAVEQAVDYVGAAMKYLDGKLEAKDLRKRIGSKSYLGD